MIVATAGHIDHGKTTLVKALTGVDTDRLPEEKARGISIDLGFAYWDAPGGATLGFVDVPGHERFVRNMLAGVCGIDYAMLVVAADDGVMPQTREHLAILDLLAIRRGVAVITKIDRVSPGRIEQVRADVAEMLASTSLAGAAVVLVSAATRAGVELLRATLASATDTFRREIQAGRHFRHAIDRVFTVPGSGTVVTGTIFDGQVVVGERLLLSPSGLEVRVRGIQMHGEAAVRAAAGERCAISISGANVEQVRRGDWLLAPPLHAPAERLDVHLRVLGSEARPLRHWTPVHLHLGTRDVTARLAMRRGGVIDAGATGRAQLILESPIAALHGDRFILRDQSGRRTIAGGTVLDPWAPHGRIDREQRSRQLDALAAEDATNALHRLAVVTPSGVDLAWFGRAFNMDARTLHELVQRAGLQMVGKDAAAVALPRASIEAIRNSIGYELGKFHRQFATAAGMEVTQLRECCAPALPLPLFRAMLRSLADDKALEFTGTLVRKTGHLAVENPLDVRLWACVRPTLESAGRGGIAISQLAAQTRQREPVLREFLLRKASIGVIVRVTPDRFFLRSQMAAFAATATRLAQDAEDGRFSAAEFRDRCAIGRTLAIDVLETLDRLAVTRRVGDARLLCQDFVPILGPAEPLSPIVPQRPPRPSSASRR